MTYRQAPFLAERKVSSITFCSCMLTGTELEQTPTKREIMLMWIKDGVAGAGLIIFMVSAFVLASGAHAIISGI